jgi:hypothetical protein
LWDSAPENEKLKRVWLLAEKVVVVYDNDGITGGNSSGGDRFGNNRNLYSLPASANAAGYVVHQYDSYALR